MNDLATTNPEIADLADGWDPTAFTWGSGAKKLFKCPVGHPSNYARIHDKTKAVKPNKCPYCMDAKALPGYNDLATTHPHVAGLVVEGDPTSVTAGSGVKMLFVCPKMHAAYYAAIRNACRESAYQGCPTCAGKLLVPGYNDLATTHPYVAALLVGMDPTTITAGYSKKVLLGCTAGHPPAMVHLYNHTRQVDLVRCKVCVGLAALEGYNDLATTHPEIAKLADGWDPRTVVAGSNKVLLFRCLFGHPSSPSQVAGRTGAKATGCPYCFPGGFDPAKPGWVYLLTQEEEGLTQVGITGNLKARLRTHERNGFIKIDTVGPLDGREAQGIEREIKNLMKRRLTPGKIALIKGASFDGYTESWYSEDMPCETISELLNMARE